MSTITRRDFVTTASAAAATALAAGATGIPGTAEAAESPEDHEAGIAWNAVYDVVVCGMGIGGETSAIEASRNGARVLVLEKAPDGLDGGNTRMCHQYAITAYEDKVEDAKTYWRAMRGVYTYPLDETIDAFCEELALNRAWFEELGATVYTYEEATGGTAFPAEHPELPGSGCVYGFGVSPVLADAAMFKFLKQRIVDDGNIDLWFEAPATDLLRDPSSGIVIGVVAEVEGRTVNIRARNGVILSTGGFESNRQMLQDYSAIAEPYPIAAPYNTGDGHLMAMRAGAQLSAMHNVMCYINCLYDDGVTAEWNSGTRFGKARYKTSQIFVGGDGTRFMNENFKARHGYMQWHGDYILQKVPTPAWCVFDEKARLDTTFSFSMADHCEQALESGRVVKADTIAELAELIGVPAENLATTVDRFNFFCSEGEDYEFHRDPSAMVALNEEGPFYAFKLVQSVLNTQGGPRRNKDAQILDTYGEPIPHLYAAGECGEIYTKLYQGSGNLGAGLVYGRVAGRNAAAAKDDFPVADGLVVEEFAPTPAEEPVYECNENQHIGTAESLCGKLVVRVTMDGDTISQVEVLHSYDTPNIGRKAIDNLSRDVVGMTADEVAAIDATLSVNVDTASNATHSSQAFKNAIADALS